MRLSEEEKEKGANTGVRSSLFWGGGVEVDFRPLTRRRFIRYRER